MLHDKAVPQQLLVIGSRRIFLFQARRYKVLELCGECAGRQSWRIILNNLSSERWRRGGRTLLLALATPGAAAPSVAHLTQLFKGRSPFVIGILPGGHFDHADAQRPDIGAYIVLGWITLRINTFRCHIWLTASVYSLCHRIDQIACEG